MMVFPWEPAQVRLSKENAGSAPTSPPFYPADTMVCTGCCSCLDHIVTYLFKQLSRSTKKRTTPLTQESDRFLHIMQQHPEMIQQVKTEGGGPCCGMARGNSPISPEFS